MNSSMFEGGGGGGGGLNNVILRVVFLLYFWGDLSLFLIPQQTKAIAVLFLC